MKRDYYKEGEAFIKDAIENFSGDLGEGYGHEEPYESEYLGSSPSIMPSGKYYMPWCTNQTDEDVEKDSAFHEGMEAAAHRAGYWIESGEGDPLDVFLCRPAPGKETEDEE